MEIKALDLRNWAIERGINIYIVSFDEVYQMYLDDNL